jgi:hypothetical protein
MISSESSKEIYDTSWAKKELAKLNPDKKYDVFLKVITVLTKLLEVHGIKPIIVGGFAVEIYSERLYSTRDLDLVIYDDDTEIIFQLLDELGFVKTNRHFEHKPLEMMIEFTSSRLAGSRDKVSKILDETNKDFYCYVISIEDIIMDRLRRYLHWEESDSRIYAMKLINIHYDSLDFDYLFTQAPECFEEESLIREWVEQVERL